MPALNRPFLTWVAATPRLDAGRAYFRSSLHDSEVDRIEGRYEVETTAGDMLYVPPWTWHAVAYDSTAVAREKTSKEEEDRGFN